MNIEKIAVVPDSDPRADIRMILSKNKWLGEL